MVRVSTKLGWFPLLLGMALFIWACGDDEGPGTGHNLDATDGDSSTDTGGSDAGADTVADTPLDQITPDQGTDQTTPDQTVDQGQDPFVDDTISDVVEPPQCDLPIENVDWPANLLDDDGDSRPIQLVILGVDFVEDIVVIKNISSNSITFDSSWRIYTHGAEGNFAGVGLAAGAILKVHLTTSGTNDVDDFYIGKQTLRIEACSGEVMIFHNLRGADTPWFNHPEYVEAFVQWGGVRWQMESGSFQDEAIGAGAWPGPFNNVATFIPTCWNPLAIYNPNCAAVTPAGTCPEETDQLGFVAVGDVSTVAGWAAVTSADDTGCFGY